MSCYNAAEFIDASIHSILNQSYTNLELIVVDDCSRDGTWERLRSWSERDPRVRCFRNASNMRQYWSRNRALIASRGDFIAVQDADDISHPDRIAVQLEFLRRSGRMACYVDGVRFDRRLKTRRQTHFGPTHTAMASLMFRRHPVLGTIGFFDDVRTSGDVEFEKRVQAQYGREAVATVRIPLYYLSIRESSVTQSLVGKAGATWSEISSEYKSSARHWHRHIAKGKADPFLRRVSSSSPFAISPDNASFNETEA